MSGIADRLRATADELLPIGSRTHDEITTIAEIIDAETVDLPIGADGEPILPRQTVYDPAGHEYRVDSISMHGNGGWSALVIPQGSPNGTRMVTESLSHKSQDSWERIADDVESLVWFDDEDEQRSRRELAGRIRRMARKEGGGDD